MIYLAKVTLINEIKETLSSEIILTDSSIKSNSLTNYQKERALHYAGIDRKVKTKYSKWVNSRLLSINIIKKINGIV